MKAMKRLLIPWRSNSKLLSESDFAGLSIKQDALKVQFDRNKTEVLEACGISEEGANLSGLPEEASEYIKLMILLAKEDHDLEHSKKVTKDKKKAVQKALLTHEIASLEEQGAFSNNGDQLLPIPTATVVAVEDWSHPLPLSQNSQQSSLSATSTSSTTPSTLRRGRTFLDTFAENIQLIVAIDPAERKLELRERKMKLDHEEQEFQARHTWREAPPTGTGRASTCFAGASNGNDAIVAQQQQEQL